VAERTLAQRDLNRALLARQLLLERSSLPAPRALERIGGIQNQYAPNAYIRLFSCVEGFRREDYTQVLERRTVVNASLMRWTIHAVSKRDYWPFAIATRGAVREWWLRVQRPTLRARNLERVAEEVRSALADGPRSQRELAELVGPDWTKAAPWLDLLRIPPSGTWERRRADLYQTAERWIGPPPEISAADAVAHLVKRYLAGFGPAAVADIAGYTGVAARDVGAALERLKLRRFRDEQGAELVDLLRAPLPDPDTPAPVRFLPTWDAILLVHARRTGVLPEEYRPRIFSTKTPHSFGTFLVDGLVAGTWRYEGGAVVTSAFASLERGVRREVAAEADRLAAWHS
jgi:Winged helix DNA-binding domain